MKKLNLVELNKFVAEYCSGKATIVEYFRQTGKVKIFLERGTNSATLLFTGCELFESESSWCLSFLEIKKHASGKYFAETREQEFYLEFDDLLILEVL